MPLVSMRQLLDHAAEHGYGIPAFNVNNLEQVQAIMAAAAEADAPVIMQASAGARKYAGEHFLRHLISAAVESYPTVPVVMHQDHGQSPKVCQGAIDLGFSSVMMDGSLEEDGNEKPKKPLNKYQQFIKDNQERIKEEFPELSNTERFTKLAEEWNKFKATLVDKEEPSDEDKEEKEQPKDEEEITEEKEKKPKKAAKKPKKNADE